MDNKAVGDLATRYAAAWCSGDPAQVASFYTEKGSLAINDGAPSIGREAIAGAAAAFMNDFPDLRVQLDRLEVRADDTVFHWTLFGTYAGGDGPGPSVQVSGYEVWTLSSDGSSIERSLGHFDEDDYQRQVGARRWR